MIHFKLSNYKTWIFLIPFLISMFVRLSFISHTPKIINPDAADNLQTYLQQSYQNAPFFWFNWNGAPSFSIHIIGVCWKVFNYTVLGARIAPTLFSSITASALAILIFLYTRRLALSLLMSISLSFNPAFLSFSTDGWENIFNSLFLCLVLGGLKLFQMHKSIHGLLLISIGAILGFYAYHPGKTFMFIALFGLIAVRSKISTILVVASCIVIFVSPQIFAMMNNSNKWSGRIADVSVFNHPNPNRTILINITNFLKGFFLFDISAFPKNYLNNRYLPTNYPPINIFFVLPMLVGLFISTKRHPEILITLLLALIPVNIFSYDTPDVGRSIHAWPVIYLTISIGLHTLLSKFASKKDFLNIVLVILVAHISFSDFTHFKTWINDSGTILFRQPAIDLNDFSAWTSQQKLEISRGGFGFNVAEWNSNRRHR